MINVGIAGAGGIGSNVAMHLVRSGVSDIRIIDFDIVEQSNLNRQFYFRNQIGCRKVYALCENLSRIQDINSIEAIELKLDDMNIIENLADCRVVVEAFDNKDDKKKLIEQLLPTGVRIVSASGIGGESLDEVTVKKVGSSLYVVGDGITDIDYNSVNSVKVSYVATIMCGVVLDIIKGGNYVQNS